MKSFKERVLENIEEHNVQSYSKAHFTIRIILLVLLAILTLVVSVFIFAFVFFIIRISGRASLLGFGPQGFWFFIKVFPWPLLLFDIGLVILLEWQLRKFRLGYRSPVLYLLLGLLAVTIALAFVVDRGTGFNDVLLLQADHHRLPGPFGDMYENARHRPPGEGICKCTITAINGNTITATDVDATGTVLTIVIPQPFPAPNPLKVGDIIFVAGDPTGSDTIQAFGIGSLPPPMPEQ